MQVYADTMKHVFGEDVFVNTTIRRVNDICNDLSNGLPAEIEARQKQYEYYRDKLLTFKEKEN